MRAIFTLKTLAWSWGVLLTTCAAGAVTLQVLDVVPAPEPIPVQQPPSEPASIQRPGPTRFAAAVEPQAAAPATPAPVAAPQAPAPAEPFHIVEPPHPPLPHLAERLPVPPIPPPLREARRVREPREVREAREVREPRVIHRPVIRYAAAPEWAPPPFWRQGPYPGQYYAYREPPRMPEPYYGWAPE